MERVSGRREMVAAMDPVLMPGRFVFCTVEDGALAAEALATFREEEGLSVLLPVARAEALGLPVESPMRQITLRVHSALEGVGLTAAVAGVLADAGIACNMIAARLHDHALVPEARAEEALALLQALQRDGEGEG
ncbi:MAG: hypothetical protein RL216_2179 [Pseudomonadota bacterium]|jgi:hypothetical protein